MRNVSIVALVWCALLHCKAIAGFTNEDVPLEKSFEEGRSQTGVAKGHIRKSW